MDQVHVGIKSLRDARIPFSFNEATKTPTGDEIKHVKKVRKQHLILFCDCN